MKTKLIMAFLAGMALVALPLVAWAVALGRDWDRMWEER